MTFIGNIMTDFSGLFVENDLEKSIRMWYTIIREKSVPTDKIRGRHLVCFEGD